MSTQDNSKALLPQGKSTSAEDKGKGRAAGYRSPRCITPKTLFTNLDEAHQAITSRSGSRPADGHNTSFAPSSSMPSSLDVGGPTDSAGNSLSSRVQQSATAGLSYTGRHGRVFPESTYAAAEDDDDDGIQQLKSPARSLKSPISPRHRRTDNILGGFELIEPFNERFQTGHPQAGPSSQPLNSPSFTLSPSVYGASQPMSTITSDSNKDFDEELVDYEVVEAMYPELNTKPSNPSELYGTTLYNQAGRQRQLPRPPRSQQDRETSDDEPINFSRPVRSSRSMRASQEQSTSHLYPSSQYSNIVYDDRASANVYSSVMPSAVYTNPDPSSTDAEFIASGGPSTCLESDVPTTGACKGSRLSQHSVLSAADNGTDSDDQDPFHYDRSSISCYLQPAREREVSQALRCIRSDSTTSMSPSHNQSQQLLSSPQQRGLAGPSQFASSSPPPQQPMIPASYSHDT
jgi:hypothetical protein